MRIQEEAVIKMLKAKSEISKALKFIEVNSFFGGLGEMDRMELALRLEVGQFKGGQVLK